MPKQLELSLPYAIIEKVASRDFLRNNKQLFTQTARASFTMPLSNIEERPGFNSRYIYDEIRELADDMYFKGQKEPLVLDITLEGKGIVDEGHRRIRALWLNVELGRITKDHPVEFYPNKTNVTELDRMIRQMTSNTNLKKDLKPFEKAKVVWNVKHLYSEKPKSHEEVAELLHVSRQTIDNLNKIAEADDRLKQEMITADMNLKDCLALVDSKKKLDQATIKAEIEANKNGVSVTPDPFDPNAKEAAELKELENNNPDIQDDENFEPVEEKPIETETEEQKHIREEKELKELLLIADEVTVKKLKHHLGKKLAKSVKETKPQDFLEEETAEVVSAEVTALFLNKGTTITADIISQLQENNVKTVFLYKPGCEPVAPSVITVAPEKEEKSKYDMGRPEIAAIQNCIKLADKMEAIINKLDVPDGTKTDVQNYVKWQQKDLAEVREWIHNNKKQNKAR